MLDYGRLSHIAKTTTPYRGTTNTYPIGKRGQSYKRFAVETDKDGIAFYRIYYQYHWEEEEVTAEVYNSRNPKKWGGRTETATNGDKKYYEYVKYWNEVGVVRKDNTFELTARSVHQGTRGFLTDMFNVYRSEVVSSVRHGGVIYREYTGSYTEGYTTTKIIPLFKGQRISLHNITSVINYEVHLSKVNRTRSKQVLEDFAEPLKFAEVLFTTLTPELFKDSLQEVFSEVFPVRDSDYMWRSVSTSRQMLEYAKAQSKVDIFKSICAYMMGYGLYNTWSVGSYNSVHGVYEPAGRCFNLAKQKIVRGIRQANGALDVKVYKANEVYPSSTWDIQIMNDFNQVVTY